MDAPARVPPAPLPAGAPDLPRRSILLRRHPRHDLCLGVSVVAGHGAFGKGGGRRPWALPLCEGCREAVGRSRWMRSRPGSTSERCAPVGEPRGSSGGFIDGAPRLHRRGHSASTCLRQPSRTRSMLGADAPVTHDDVLVGVVGHLAYARGTEPLHRIAASHERLATRTVPIA